MLRLTIGHLLLMIVGFEIVVANQASHEILLNKSVYVSVGGESQTKPPEVEREGHGERAKLVDFDDWPEESTPGEQPGRAPDLGRPADSALALERADQSRSANQSNLMRELSAPISPGVENLNGGFLVLFDEITRMKNNSINALIRLQYFNNNSLNKQYDFYDGGATNNSGHHLQLNSTSSNGGGRLFSTPNKPNVNQQRFDIHTIVPTNKGFKTTTTTTTTTTDSNKSYNNNKQQSPLMNHGNQPAASLAGKINWQLYNWFEVIHKKVSGFLNSIATGLSLSSLGPNNLRHQTSRISTKIIGTDRANSGRQRDRTYDGRDHELSKRHTSGPMPFAAGSQDNQVDGSYPQTCVQLNPNQQARCKSIELLVSYNLNNSFPGTQQTIEDNCRHISNLLSDCWPQQLQHLRLLLASWNETVLSMTDFPLPPAMAAPAPAPAPANIDPARDSMGQPRRVWSPSCGIRHQLPALVMDRINWMWLNLCMDKKFRLDYVENLRCLSQWTQERAQAVCSNEYKRMQLNLRPSPAGHYGASSPDHQRGTIGGSVTLTGHDESIPLRRQPRGVDFVPSINIQTSLTSAAAAEKQQSRARQTSPDGLDEREIESKILCCVFDLFLRCVNRQAVRDCGRHGGQFVVNFMSRIGTDDMKYLCNSEPRHISSTVSDINRHPFNQHQQQQQQQIISSGIHSTRTNQRSTSLKKNYTSADRSPFIQSNYCTDTRIVAVLYGNLVGVYGDKNESPGGNTRTNTNSDNLGNRHLQSGSYHDTTFFESDQTTDSSCSRLVVSLPRVVLLLSICLSNWMMIRPHVELTVGH